MPTAISPYNTWYICITTRGNRGKAQYRVRDIMEKLYSATPDGYCGDEDNGQTSAWYIFSALDSIPVCPGSDQYIIGTPLFKEAKLHLENGEVPDHRGQKQQLGKQIYSFDKTQRKEPHAQLFQAQYLGRRRENTILHGQRTTI